MLIQGVFARRSTAQFLSLQRPLATLAPATSHTRLPQTGQREQAEVSPRPRLLLGPASETAVTPSICTVQFCHCTNTSLAYVRSTKKGSSDEEKKSFLIKAAAAAAAVLAIGLAVYKAKVSCQLNVCVSVGSLLWLIHVVLQNKNEEPYGDYEDRFDKTKHEARANVDKTKHQASDSLEDFKHQAERAKHKVAEIIPQPVKNTADKVSDKAHQAQVRTVNKMHHHADVLCVLLLACLCTIDACAIVVAPLSGAVPLASPMHFYRKRLVKPVRILKGRA